MPSKQKINKARLIKVTLVAATVMIAFVYFNFGFERIQAANSEIFPDSKTYYELAMRVVNEGVYSESWPEANHYRAWRPPFYTWFVAAGLLVGDGTPEFVAIVQQNMLVLFGLIMFALSYKVFRSFETSFLTLLAIYLYPLFYFYASFLMSEIVFMMLFYGALLLIYHALGSKQKKKQLFLAGILLGFSCLTRTIAMPWILLATVFLAGMILAVIIEKYLKRPHQCIKFLAILLLGTWMVILPWSIRNYKVLDAPVLINTANGYNLFRGGVVNNNLIDWDEINDIQNTITEDEVEFGEAMIDLMIARLIERPDQYWSQRKYTLGNYIFLKIQGKGDVFYDGLLKWRTSANLVLWFLWMIGGLAIILRNNPKKSSIFILFWALALSSSLSFYSERIVLPVLPLYLMIAAHGGVSLFEMGRLYALNKPNKSS